MRCAGFTLLEVLAAVVMIALFITPLSVEGSRQMDNAEQALLIQRAMRLAEQTMNEIHLRGYTYYAEEGYRGEDDDAFDIAADISAEQILISSLLATDQAEEETEEEKIVVLHVTVTVTSREYEDIGVTLALDLPAEGAAIKGVEDLLPEDPDEEEREKE